MSILILGGGPYRLLNRSCVLRISRMTRVRTRSAMVSWTVCKGCNFFQLLERKLVSTTTHGLSTGRVGGRVHIRCQTTVQRIGNEWNDIEFLANINHEFVFAIGQGKFKSIGCECYAQLIQFALNLAQCRSPSHTLHAHIIADSMAAGKASAGYEQ